MLAANCRFGFNDFLTSCRNAVITKIASCHGARFTP